MSEPVKVTVAFYSATGNVTGLARAIAAAAEKAGAEVRLRRVAELAPQAAIDSNPAWAENVKNTADIAEVTPDDVDWADAVFLGSPTRFGNVASQLKQFIDTLGGLWFQGKLAGKVYSGFAAASGKHGGNESTLLALYNSFHHFGGIVVAPGYSNETLFANASPYGVSHWNGTEIDDTTLAAAAAQAERVVETAAALKAGRAALAN
ncbi:NAD(P)H:quinone oxidoreductase [Glycomyces algeriensis]|jgi:NAD(P)H dehydrogenase (quinone)|uniref:NAD(P)H:quinone oxidoreductase type IV n=1 Tax=Glycomyces algeriensis TaxID=256037 RepID=A0A9W6G5B0_9ACTN|nr:NAD(P)H:quinone oxidoreductase [Glycomyces algeriensis]MDA1367769.1 NAD(P)H:quinone oxidoreductase [Glycomyces algeriensis]MDR7352867.1 NAD(P)H dehydrogenase (quinone) [Glycomyces algeriensis]GLI40553.1 NAD(P)H:quinone oxidoreductase type IV [Glycomyces algeriensis]